MAGLRRDRGAHAGAGAYPAASAVPLVWSRGLGHLIEFPAVVERVCVHRERPCDRPRDLDALRQVRLGCTTRRAPRAWPRRRPCTGTRSSTTRWAAGCTSSIASTGISKWSWNAGSAIESSPIVVNGIDYFGTASGEMYALDLRTHRLRWKRYLGAKITSSAAIADGRLFIGDYGGRLWALSPATGATRWVGPREREDLRDAGRRHGPGVRSLVDRRLADRLLDQRALPLARHRRLLRLLVSRGRGRRRLLRLVRRLVLRRLCRDRARPVAYPDRRTRSREPP